ncbi:MAG: ribosome maturation factor RimM [Spirochaetia bacterium]
MTKSLAIGKLTKPFGLKGAIKVRSFSGEFDHFFSLEKKEVELRHQDQILRTRIESVQVKGDALVIIFNGYCTPEHVGEIRGYEIFVPRDLATPLKEGEYYLSDLIGSTLLFQGQSIGIIRHFFEAAQIVLEVERIAADPLYIPFLKVFIGDIDLKNQTVELLDDRLL